MMTTLASYQPQRLLREVAVDPRQAAVLFIDTQNFNCHRGGAMYRNFTPEDLEGPDFAYWWARVDECLGKWQQLQQAARSCGIEVIYTVIQSLTRDGRDRSLDYKISGFHVPPGCWDAKVLDVIKPGPDEVVLPKSSSSVFNSTTLDYLLRNMDKRFLLLAGCVTDQCVAHAVKDAADLGYLVTLVTDCCATYSAERHQQACSAVAGYCRQRTLEALLEELRAVTAKTGSGGGQFASNGGAEGGAAGGRSTAGGGAAGFGAYNAGPSRASGGQNGRRSGGGLGGSGVFDEVTDAGAGYKRGYETMMGLQGTLGPAMAAAATGDMQQLANGPLLEPLGELSGDNFSRGMLGSQMHSGSMGYLDEAEAAAAAGGYPGVGVGGRDSRGGSSRGTQQKSKGRVAAAVSNQADKEGKKPVYFEYAKMQWETDQEFLLPDGSSWVEIAVKGDPSIQERGLVFCRLCRHNGKGNVFAKGYKAGKRSALKEHMATKDHRELVEALEAGQVDLPAPGIVQQDYGTDAAAGAETAAGHSRGKRGRALPPAAPAAVTAGSFRPPLQQQQPLVSLNGSNSSLQALGFQECLGVGPLPNISGPASGGGGYLSTPAMAAAAAAAAAQGAIECLNGPSAAADVFAGLHHQQQQQQGAMGFGSSSSQQGPFGSEQRMQQQYGVGPAGQRYTMQQEQPSPAGRQAAESAAAALLGLQAGAGAVGSIGPAALPSDVLRAGGPGSLGGLGSGAMGLGGSGSLVGSASGGLGSGPLQPYGVTGGPAAGQLVGVGPGVERRVTGLQQLPERHQQHHQAMLVPYGSDQGVQQQHQDKEEVPGNNAVGAVLTRLSTAGGNSLGQGFEPAAGVPAAAAAAAWRPQQRTPAAAGTAGSPTTPQSGGSSGGSSSVSSIAAVIAAAAAAAGVPSQSLEGVQGLKALMAAGSTATGQADLTPEQAAAALTTAFQHAAAAAGINAATMAEAFAAATEGHHGAGSSQARQQQVLPAVTAVASRRCSSQSGSGTPVAQQQQQPLGPTLQDRVVNSSSMGPPRAKGDGAASQSPAVAHQQQLLQEHQQQEGVLADKLASSKASSGNQQQQPLLDHNHQRDSIAQQMQRVT